MYNKIPRIPPVDECLTTPCLVIVLFWPQFSDYGSAYTTCTRTICSRPELLVTAIFCPKTQKILTKIYNFFLDSTRFGLSIKTWSCTPLTPPPHCKGNLGLLMRRTILSAVRGRLVHNFNDEKLVHG